MTVNKKRYAFYSMLALCIVALVLRVADLAFYTEKNSVFAAQGSVWLRYIPLLAFAAAGYGASHFVAVRPRALLHRCSPLGVAMMLTGTALAAVGLSDFSPLMNRGATVQQYAACLLPMLAAVWFWRFSAKAFSGAAGRGGQAPNAISGVLPVAYFIWLLIKRFAIEPASIQRIGGSLRVLGAAAVLLFLPPLLKVFMVPGGPDGHALFATGINVFMLGNCSEFVQACYEIRHGLATVDSLLESIVILCVGFCGILCAWYAVGTDLEKKGRPAAFPAAGNTLWRR